MPTLRKYVIRSMSANAKLIPEAAAGAAHCADWMLVCVVLKVVNMKQSQSRGFPCSDLWVQAASET